MGFTEAVRSCLSKYADFSGRAPRSEYWFFSLFFFLVAIAVILIGVAIGAATRMEVGMTIAGVLVALFGLGMLLPHLAVMIRRLHDINLSGWWYLVAFLPFGGFAILAFTFMPGTRGANRFGPDPFEDRYVAEVFD